MTISLYLIYPKEIDTYTIKKLNKLSYYFKLRASLVVLKSTNQNRITTHCICSASTYLSLLPKSSFSSVLLDSI